MVVNKIYDMILREIKDCKDFREYLDFPELKVKKETEERQEEMDVTAQRYVSLKKYV